MDDIATVITPVLFVSWFKRKWSVAEIEIHITKAESGNGSEIAIACDMSFASREKTIISQWEVALEWSPAEDRWPGCHNSLDETELWRCS